MFIRRVKKSLVILCSLILFVGCASYFLKYDKAEDLKKNDEFENTVKIEVIEEPAVPVSTDLELKETASAPAAVTQTITIPTTTIKKKITKKTPVAAKKEEIKRRQPELESDIGFDGRRPLIDPYGVGEKVIHNVSYMGISAGTLNLESRNYAQVNGRKNYQFRISIKTSSLFNTFYSVDDYVDVLMDFETLVPSVFKLHVRESGQLREGQMFFDHEKLKATYWEKKVTKRDGEQNIKQEWSIEPYTQSLFSAVFYLRFFQWDVGTENAFRVTDDEKNLVFRGKCIRKEKIKTDAGEFNAIVIKPEVELRGKFQTIGDNFIWLSDDDRRYILKIESKIKIGTLVSEVEKIEPGR